MKVLRAGRPPQDFRVYRGECLNCDCLFEFRANEATPKVTGLGTTLEINCPSCEQKIRIAVKD